MYYLLCYMIEPMQVGTVAQALPLHMTIVHWFQSSAAQRQIVLAVNKAASKQNPLRLVVGEQDLFGVDKNVIVNRVDRTKDLLMLHKSLVQMLDELGAQHTNDNWVGNGWNPHVTHKAKSSLSPNDTFIVDSVSVVSTDDFKHGLRNLLATVNFN